MSLRWYTVRRVAWMIVTAWLVLSMAFFVFAYTPDPNENLVAFGAGYAAAQEGGNVTAAQQEALSGYRQIRNYDVPVYERYAKWMVSYATLDWGTTFDGRPVAGEVGRAMKVTLTYLVPALLLATLGALAVGVFGAVRHGRLADRLAELSGYAGYGLPVFFVGEMVFAVLVNDFGMVWLSGDSREALYSMDNIVRFILPAAIMALNLLAVQLVYIRAEMVEHLHEEFVKTLRANGATARTIVRHALRNAAVPLVSVFFAEVLTVLYLGVIVVETVFGLPGFGALTIDAIQNREIGLILGTTFVPLFVGVIGNFVQDMAYTVLDPRVDYD